MMLPVTTDSQEDSPEPFELKTLKPKHKQAMSLLAQGLGREEVSKMVGYTPEYLTMLLNQPLCQKYIEEMNLAVDNQLRSLYSRSVEVLAEAMKAGTMNEKLQGAQTTLRALGKDKTPDKNVGTTFNINIGIVR